MKAQAKCHSPNGVLSLTLVEIESTEGSRCRSCDQPEPDPVHKSGVYTNRLRRASRVGTSHRQEFWAGGCSSEAQNVQSCRQNFTQSLKGIGLSSPEKDSCIWHHSFKGSFCDFGGLSDCFFSSALEAFTRKLGHNRRCRLERMAPFRESFGRGICRFQELRFLFLRSL